MKVEGSVKVCVILAGVFCGNILIKQGLIIVLKDVKGDCICILIQKRNFILFFDHLFAEVKTSFEVITEHARA